MSNITDPRVFAVRRAVRMASSCGSHSTHQAELIAQRRVRENRSAGSAIFESLDYLRRMSGRSQGQRT